MIPRALPQLPAKLRAFSNSPQTDGVLVLVDADDDNCAELAKDIQRAKDHCAPDLEVIAAMPRSFMSGSPARGTLCAICSTSMQSR